MIRADVNRDRVIVAPSERRAALLDLVAAARRRICLSLFRGDDQGVLQALVEAAARGVDVRVLVTGRARRSRLALTQVHNYLARQGVAVRRWTGASKYHAKFAVFDSEVAVVGTGNYTKKGFSRTLDFVVVTVETGVVRGLAALFAADWAGHDMPPLIAPAGPHGRLIVGPSPAPRRRFRDLVRRAQRSVRVLDAKLTDRRLLEELDALRAAGCAVELRCEPRLGGWRSHGKLLLVDDDVAVIGSMAWSRQALERRRELAIVIRDRRIVSQLHALWHALPTSSRHDPLLAREQAAA